MMGFKCDKLCMLLVFAIFLISCKNKKIKSKKFSQKINCYTLRIDNVECAMCAKKAILALESLPNVKNVEFICKDHHYQDCFARMYLKDRYLDVSVQEISNKLSEFGFELNSLT